jgi:DNA-binding NarL/FixJ family response regulator
MKIKLLSPREHDVIALLAKGLSYQDIAIELHISHETVKKHVNNIYRKLNVNSKIQALLKMKLI